jgi:hypothetical protein
MESNGSANENAARINRDARGGELADESRRAARSVRNSRGLRRNSRSDYVDGRYQVLPNDTGGNLRPLATGLIEEDADVAIVVIVDAAPGAKSQRARFVIGRRQAMMVVMCFLGHQLM